MVLGGGGGAVVVRVMVVAVMRVVWESCGVVEGAVAAGLGAVGGLVGWLVCREPNLPKHMS